MKRSTLSIGAALAFAGALVATSAVSQEKSAAGSKPGEMDPKMAEMMKKCEEAGTPGPGHKALDHFVGQWNVECKSFMPGSDKPEVSKGTASAKWIMGNRFLQEEFTGEMMGKPFKGVSTTGYDNVKKKYVGSWIDDMSTGMFNSEGTADSANKVFSYEGKSSDPMTGQSEKPFKFTIRILSPDKHTFEMHDPSLGDKSKMMEMTYTRK